MASKRFALLRPPRKHQETWRLVSGINVGMGRDHTLFSLAAGKVKFDVNGALNRRVVSVEPVAEPSA